MDRRAHLRQKIDRTVVALTDRVNELEELAGGVREQVRRSVSLEYQIRERPWTCMAVAVAGGFVLGRLLR